MGGFPGGNVEPIVDIRFFFKQDFCGFNQRFFIRRLNPIAQIIGSLGHLQPAMPWNQGLELTLQAIGVRPVSTSQLDDISKAFRHNEPAGRTLSF